MISWWRNSARSLCSRSDRPRSEATHNRRHARADVARTYQLTTKRGTTTFQTGEEWLAAWAKLVRGCKAARALDKLQTALQTNQAHIAAMAAFDPEPAATLTAELDRALNPTHAP
jgi:hypothetical protein